MNTNYYRNSSKDNNSSMANIRSKQLPKCFKILKFIFMFGFVVVIVDVLFHFIVYSVKYNHENINLTALKYNMNQIKAENNDLSIKYNQLKRSKTEVVNSRFKLKEAIIILNEEKVNIEKELKDKKSKIQTVNEYLNAKNEELNRLNSNSHYLEEINLLLGEITKLQENMLTLRLEDVNHNRNEENNDIDSKIISTDQVKQLKKLFNFGPNLILSFNLLYRMSDDGYSLNAFHSKCDITDHTVTILKLTDNTIIGGYTEKSWKGIGYKTDPEAFLFSLTLNKKYKIKDKTKSIYADPDYFVVFGKGDLLLMQNSQSSLFPCSYEKGVQKYELTNGKLFFQLKEFEVFRVTFQYISSMAYDVY